MQGWEGKQRGGEGDNGTAEASGDPDFLARGPRGSSPGRRQGVSFLANMTVHRSFPENTRETPGGAVGGTVAPGGMSLPPSLGITPGEVIAHGVP